MAQLPAMARTHPEIERSIHKALEENRAKQADSAFTVRLSSIGKCQRELWAIRTGIPDEGPPPGRTLMTFDVGNSLEYAVILWLTAAGYTVETRGNDGRQLAVEMSGGAGIGHLDGIIQWGRKSDGDVRLLEVKTAKAKKFAELQAAGSYRAWNADYYAQVQAYMGASHTGRFDVPALWDCLVVVVSKDTSELWCEMIRFDEERYAQLEAKAKLVVESETIVPRPPEAKSHGCNFCKWCSRKQWCWDASTGVEFDD